MDKDRLIKYIKELDEFRDDLDGLLESSNPDVSLLASQLVKMSGLVEYLATKVFPELVNSSGFKDSWGKIKEEKAKEKKEKEEKAKKEK